MIRVRAAGVGPGCLVKPLIGAAAGRERCRARRRQIEVGAVDQVHTAAAYVRSPEADGTHLPLDGEVPLLGIGGLQIRIDAVDVLHRSGAGAQEWGGEAE